MPTTTVNDLVGNIRMTLLADEFIADLKPQRFKAGTVVLVNEETAERWERLRIAVPSSETDKTAAEIKRDLIARLQAEVEELESGKAKTSGVFDRAIGRDGPESALPARRAGRGR